MIKIIGLGLVVLGILIIVWGLWSSYQVFNGNRPVPEIFAAAGDQQETKSDFTGTAVEKQIRQALGEQMSKLISADSMPKMFNLISWSIFMFIVIYAGAKISDIGVKLLRSK